jgi:AcrR family transcriptional regulator
MGSQQNDDSDRGDPQVASGRIRQKLRTKRELLAAASAMLAAGRTPTVTEVADAAAVSRRTAYRYFPTQTKLLAEAALEGIRPRMEAAIRQSAGFHGPDVAGRIDALVATMFREAFASEKLLRTMVHTTVLERQRPDLPKRGIRRIEWIEAATEPLRRRLGPAGYARLVSGLALCVGIEALLVLVDIRGLSARQTVATARWMARAVLRQSLDDASAAKG